MTELDFHGVLVVFAAAVAAPLIAQWLRRLVAIPSTVLEIGLGVLIGPALLGWVHASDFVEGFSQLGLAMLFFLAGYEINFRQIVGRPLKLAAVGWLISLAIGLIVALVVTRHIEAALIVGIGVSTTALGTILPMVRDAGMLKGALGARIMAVGAVGEFAPIVAIAVLLGGGRPLTATLSLIGFGAVAVFAAYWAARPQSGHVRHLLSATLGTSVQFAVRLSILAVCAMVWIASELGLDIILGAFAAGIAIRLLIATIDREEAHVVESKLEAVGFGLLVPFFFVVTGVNFDLDALVGSPAAMVTLPAILLLFLLTRGLVTYFLNRKDLPKPENRRLALLASTQLPLVVVVANLGVEDGWISSATGAAMIGAGMLSVLIFPLLALRKPAASESAAESSGQLKNRP